MQRWRVVCWLVCLGRQMAAGVETPAPSAAPSAAPSEFSVGWSLVSTSLAMQYGYTHGVLGSDGQIYAPPFHDDSILVIDPSTDGVSFIDVSATVQATSSKYFGAVASGDVVYFTPHTSNDIGVFNVTTQTFSVIDVSGANSDSNKYKGGVLMDDGSLVFVPYNSNNVGLFDPATATFSVVDISGEITTPGKFVGGALADDLLAYFAPSTSGAVGRFTPGTNYFELISIGCWDDDYFGLVAVGMVLYLVPHNANRVGKFDVETDSFTYLDITEHLTTGGKFSGGVLGDDGKIYFVPSATAVIGVYNPTANTFATIGGTGLDGSTFKFFGGVDAGNGVIYTVPGTLTDVGKFRYLRPPSASPTTASPVASTQVPTVDPTASPSSVPSPVPSNAPTSAPTSTSAPAALPTAAPSPSPSSAPTSAPSSQPTGTPTLAPALPTAAPSPSPSAAPNPAPTSAPTACPTGGPTTVPTFVPTSTPTAEPSDVPSNQPTATPSRAPVSNPTSSPSATPTLDPSSGPTSEPSSAPTDTPSSCPTLEAPTANPTQAPTSSPSATPTVDPTFGPTNEPSIALTVTPTTTTCSDDVDILTPPTLQGAEFDSTGANVIVTFDVDTDRAGYVAGVNFACSEVVAFQDAASAICLWTDGRRLLADVSGGSLIPGQTISIAENSQLRRYCDVNCDCFRYAVNGTVAVQPPQDAVTPFIVLEGQNTADSCDGVTVDSTASTGGGGRDFIEYTWDTRVTEPQNTSINITLLDAVTQRHAGSRKWSLTPTEVASLYNVGVRSLRVQLQLRNFLNATATDHFPVIVRSSTPPALEVVNGLRHSFRRSETVSVRANAIATSCDGRPEASRAVTLHWLMLAPDSDDDTAVGWTSTSNDPRLFQLPPYTLEAGASYQLQVTATDTVLNETSSAVCEVTIEHAEIVAIIDGGTSRSASASDTILMSADSSYDADLDVDQNTSNLNFYWSCDNVCTSALSGALDDSQWFTRSAFEFPASLIGNASVWFSLNVSSADGRVGSTSQVVEVVEDTPPRVEISLSSGTVSATSKVALYASAAPASNASVLSMLQSQSGLQFNTTWLVESGDLANGYSLDEWSTTRTVIVAPTSLLSSDVSFTRQHNLVLSPGALVPGTRYTFKLEARLEGSTATGYAKVSVYATPAPFGGTLQVSPSQGRALETAFRIETRNWAAEAMPLTYAFRVVDGAGTTSVLRSAQAGTSLGSARLPAGSPNVSVVAFAYDSLGGAASLIRSVRCTEVYSIDVNATRSMLETALALGSVETVFQIVVSAASVVAAANETELYPEYIDAIATVVSAQDDAPDLVEQAATSLSPLTSRKSSLDGQVASSVLTVTRTLAEKSSDLGEISDLSTESLALTLSNLLDSALFDTDLTSTNASDGIVDDFDASLTSLLDAQAQGLVADEEPARITTPNIHAAVVKLPGTASDGGERVIGLLESDSAIVVPASLPGQDGFFDVALAEILSSSRPWKDDTNSRFVRIAVAPDADSIRRRRLGVVSQSNLTTSIQFVFGPTLAEAVDPMSALAFETNVSCDCNYVGNVTVTCPSGTVLTMQCWGELGSYTLACPKTAATTYTWHQGGWADATCSTWYSANGTMTMSDCVLSVDSTSDFAVRNRVSDSYAEYTEDFLTVDAGRALYMFVFLGLVVAVCCCLVIYGAWLDWRQAPLVGDKPRPFVAAFGQLAVIHGRFHIDNTRVRTEKVAARPDHPSSLRTANQGHPLLLNQKMRVRYLLALASTHPFVNWYYCYSPTVGRPLRVMVLGFECLFFAFVLAVEVRLLWVDPGCSNQTSKGDCLQFEKAFWAGGSTMCQWEDCKCEADLPSFHSSTVSPHHYLVLVIVLALAYPVLRIFNVIFEQYIIAPPPALFRRLLGRRSAASVYVTENDDEHNADVQKPLERWVSHNVIDYDDADSATGPARVPPSATKSPVSPATVSREEKLAAVKAKHAAYLKASLNMAGVLRQKSNADQSRNARARSVMEKFRRTGGEGSLAATTGPMSLAAQAYGMGPSVAEQVISQLEELWALREAFVAEASAAEMVHASSLDKLAKQMACIDKLVEHFQRRWRWHPDFHIFIDNVEEKVCEDLMTAHRWRDDVLTMKARIHESDFSDLATQKLHELERVARMSYKERMVWESCMNRAELVLVAPEKPPGLAEYLAAWIALLSLIAGVCMFLLSTASKLGRKQSVLFLAHVAVTAVLTYVFVYPIECFVFYVLIPNLLWERLMTKSAGALKKFPFTSSAQPPYSLRFLIDMEPSLRKLPEAKKIVYGEKSRDAGRTGAILSGSELVQIYAYETWRPALDTYMLLSIVGTYSTLPIYFQQVFFEELCALIPLLASVITQSRILSTLIPRRFLTIAILAISLLLAAIMYLLLEMFRFAVRTFAPYKAAFHEDQDNQNDTGAAIDTPVLASEPVVIPSADLTREEQELLRRCSMSIRSTFDSDMCTPR